MPTTLPVKFFAVPATRRPKLSILSSVLPAIVVISLWSAAMLAISLLEIRLGVLTETFNNAF